MNTLSLDDLPKHSEWTAYLLDPDADPPRDLELFTGTETYETIYSHMLESYRDSSMSREAFVRQGLGTGPDEDVISLEEDLYLVDDDELVEQNRSIVREALEPVLTGDETVLDLGFGWGWTLGTIADAFPDVQVVGGEYSEAGVELARELYADEGRITVTQFDFYEDWERLVPVGEKQDVVVFTKGSLVTVPDIDPLVEQLEHLVQTAVVRAGVHLEQTGPHPETVLGLLRERYARERGYRLDVLDHLEEASQLQVTDISDDVMGDNPLHPLTEIRWEMA